MPTNLHVRARAQALLDGMAGVRGHGDAVLGHSSPDTLVDLDIGVPMLDPSDATQRFYSITVTKGHGFVLVRDGKSTAFAGSLVLSERCILDDCIVLKHDGAQFFNTPHLDDGDRGLTLFIWVATRLDHPGTVVSATLMAELVESGLHGWCVCRRRCRTTARALTPSPLPQVPHLPGAQGADRRVEPARRRVQRARAAALHCKAPGVAHRLRGVDGARHDGRPPLDRRAVLGVGGEGRGA